MKHIILDTHTLVWFLQKDKKLPKTALKTILSAKNIKVIPFIVLCEIYYLNAKGRFHLPVQDLINTLEQTRDFVLASHEPEQIQYFQKEFEIHDGLIVATACAIMELKEGAVQIISKDKAISKFSPVPVIWK